MQNKAIIVGDSSYNTIGMVRSVCFANIKTAIVLISNKDWCNVMKSRYAKEAYLLDSFEKVLPLLENIKESDKSNFILCSCDAAAEWVDKYESILSKSFITPCRGNQIDSLFNKAVQCDLAKRCGLTVPNYKVHIVGNQLFLDDITFPVITKPLVSTKGSKSDIHICHNIEELTSLLQSQFEINTELLIQEYITKEYEINCIGVSTNLECVIAGAIKKLRHFRNIYGAATFARIDDYNKYGVDEKKIEAFIRESGYHGPFSVEFVHSNGINYFMEFNFRNDGLAYTATCAGANIYEAYINNKKVDVSHFHPIYMMDIQNDFNNTIEKKYSVIKWLFDCFRAKCHIDFCLKDLYPSVYRVNSFLYKKLFCHKKHDTQ